MAMNKNKIVFTSANAANRYFHVNYRNYRYARRFKYRITRPIFSLCDCALQLLPPSHLRLNERKYDKRETLLFFTLEIISEISACYGNTERMMKNHDYHYFTLDLHFWYVRWMRCILNCDPSSVNIDWSSL